MIRYFFILILFISTAYSSFLSATFYNHKLSTYAEILENNHESHRVTTSEILHCLKKLPDWKVSQVVAWALKLVTPEMGGSRIYLLNALANISPHEMEDVCTWAQKFFTEKTGGRERCEVLRAITSLKPNERPVACKYALKYFKDKIVKFYSYSSIHLLSILKAHKEENLPTICEYLKIFLTKEDFLLYSSVRAFFEKSQDMDEFKKRSDWALKLTGDEVQKDGFFYLFKEILSLPKNRLDDICSHVFKNSTFKMSNWNKRQIVHIFKETPPEKWNSLLIYAMETANGMTEKDKYFEALRIWGKIFEKNWEKIIKKNDLIDHETFKIISHLTENEKSIDFLMCLLEETADDPIKFQKWGNQLLKFKEIYLDYNVLKQGLKILKDIEPDNLQPICEYALNIFSTSWWDYKNDKVLAELLENLDKIPPALLTKIRDFDSQLRWGHEEKDHELRVDQRLEVIKTLGFSPPEDWKKALNLSRDLLGEKAPEAEKNTLMLILLNIPTQKWDPLSQNALKIFTKNMGVKTKIYIIESLIQYPSNFLPILAEYAPKYLKLGMTTGEVLEILEILVQKVIPSNRMEAISQRISFLTSKPDIGWRAAVVGLSLMPEERWVELEKQASFFIKNEMDLHEKTVEILNLSLKESTEVVEVLCKYDFLFKIKDMNKEEKVNLFNELERINKIWDEQNSFPPRLSLKEAIKNALPFIIRMDLKDKLQIIEAFIELNEYYLKDVLKYVPRLITPKMEAFLIRDLIKLVGSYYELERKKVISRILEIKKDDMVFEIPILLKAAKWPHHLNKFDMLIKYFPSITRMISGKEINPEFYEKKFQSWHSRSIYEDFNKITHKLLKFNKDRLHTTFSTTFKLIDAAQIYKFTWEEIAWQEIWKLMNFFRKTDPNEEENIRDYALKIIKPGMDLTEILTTVQELKKINRERLESSFRHATQLLQLVKIPEMKHKSTDMLDFMQMLEWVDSNQLVAISQHIPKFESFIKETIHLKKIAHELFLTPISCLDNVCEYTLRFYLEPEIKTEVLLVNLNRFSILWEENVERILKYVPSFITKDMEWGEIEEILTNLNKYNSKYIYYENEKRDDPFGLMAKLLLQSSSDFRKFYKDKIPKSINISALPPTNPLFEGFQILEGKHGKFYKKLYKQRKTWKHSLCELKPIEEKIDNKFISLQPFFFQCQLREHDFTLQDLKGNYESLQSYFWNKIEKFEKYISVGNEDFIEKTKQITRFNHPNQFLHIKEKLRPYLTIFDRQKTGEDFLLDGQLKLFRLLAIFQEKDDIKTEEDMSSVNLKSKITLSEGEKKLLRFLSTVHRCPESVSLGIKKAYHKYALSTLLLKDMAPPKIIKQILIHIMEELIYTVKKRSFYKMICEEEGFSCENQQIMYVQNLVGGAVGLDPWLNMEGNPELIYPNLLKLSPYKVLEYFYEEQLSPTEFINKFKKYFTQLETPIWDKLKIFYCDEQEVMDEEAFTNLNEKAEISTKVLIELLEYEKIIDIKKKCLGKKKMNYRESSSEEEDYSF